MLGGTDDIPTLPQEEEEVADIRERNEQLLQAQALYRWNSEVSQRLNFDDYGLKVAFGIDQRTSGVSHTQSGVLETASSKAA